jgi:hypothetical protein
MLKAAFDPANEARFRAREACALAQICQSPLAAGSRPRFSP